MGVRENIIALIPSLASDEGLDARIAFADKQVAQGLPNRDVGVTYKTLALTALAGVPMSTSGAVLEAKVGGVSRKWAGSYSAQQSSKSWASLYDDWVMETVSGLPGKRTACGYLGVY